MSQHTPGPWFIVNGAVYKDEDGSMALARMERNALHTSPVERDANARLIAKAPEMLAWIAFMLGSDAAPREFANEGDAQFWYEQRDAINSVLREIEGA